MLPILQPGSAQEKWKCLRWVPAVPSSPSVNQRWETNQASLLSTIISVSQSDLLSRSLDSFPGYLPGVHGGWEALCCRTPERSAPTLGRKTKLCLHPIAPNPSPSFHTSIHNFNRMSLDYLLLISTHFLHIFLTRIVAMWCYNLYAISLCLFTVCLYKYILYI